MSATEKWSDPWFRKLPPIHKVLWLFLCDNCDHAGIWKVDMDALEYYIGSKFHQTEVLQQINHGKERIKAISDNEWFITTFVLFQQKVDSLELLNPNNKCHLSIIRILSKKGLLSPYQAPTKPLVRGLGIGIGIGIGKGNNKRFTEIWNRYPNKDGRKQAERFFLNTVKTDQDWEDINKALDNYLKSEKVSKGFIKNGSTWFNNWKDWVEFVDPNSNNDVEEIIRMSKEGSYATATT
jgi:hypothetical protein